MSLDLTRLHPAFDALCLTAIRNELRATAMGGAIQRVEVRSNELALEIYAHHARHRLLCRVGDDATRIHFTTRTAEPSAPPDSPMLLQLRKHVRGGRLVAIDQPRLERTLRLEITKRDDDGISTCALIIETMGRRSNAILLDGEGRILDALRRTPPSRSPSRPVLPHITYLAPPPQDRADPESPNLAETLAAVAEASAPGTLAADILGHTVAGISPLVSKEVVYRAQGSADAAIAGGVDWQSIARSVGELIAGVERGADQPHVVFHEGHPIAIAPYRPLLLASQDSVALETFPSMSEAVEAAFGTAVQVRRTPRSAADVVRRIVQTLETERRREQALAREIADAAEIERLRLFGEAILASTGSITPGATELEFNGLTVPLDRLRSPIEVANSYFADYRKRRDAAAHVPALREEVAQRIEYLEGLAAMAEATDSQAAHRQIARELDTFLGTASDRPKRRAVHQEPQPRRYDAPDGTTVLVGTNGAMNERVTFKIASSDDLWMHARGEPGAHVVLRTAGREPHPETLQFAANLAARYSRGRSSGSVLVDYTEVKHVRKIRGAPPGLVRYVQERTIRGYPDEAG